MTIQILRKWQYSSLWLVPLRTVLGEGVFTKPGRPGAITKMCLGGWVVFGWVS